MMKPNHAITIKLARVPPRSFERSRIPRRVSTSTRTITIASGPRLWQSPAAALRPARRANPTTARVLHSSFCWQAELRLRHSPVLNSQPQSNPVKPSQTIGVATACRDNIPAAAWRPWTAAVAKPSRSTPPCRTRQSQRKLRHRIHPNGPKPSITPYWGAHPPRVSFSAPSRKTVRAGAYQAFVQSSGAPRRIARCIPPRPASASVLTYFKLF